MNTDIRECALYWANVLARAATVENDNSFECTLKCTIQELQELLKEV